MGRWVGVRVKERRMSRFPPHLCSGCPVSPGQIPSPTPRLFISTRLSSHPMTKPRTKHLPTHKS